MVYTAKADLFLWIVWEVRGPWAPAYPAYIETRACQRPGGGLGYSIASRRVAGRAEIEMLIQENPGFNECTQAYAHAIRWQKGELFKSEF
ncbi:hypothetical protein DPEC_G00043320 [Dallia pectoralis]|uniref:Uncharacterized protein n=1 Tax=Dallia pectoralis TaxID=75939 RepID=A0ACC2H9D3_DALPE|nr:hypothetical protein DPEC_G00043320 [Dallia pectoralis]